MKTPRSTLDIFFAPRSVALIGATEKPDSVGRAILWNLIQSPFGGTIYPVNPKRSSVLGIRAYTSVADVPEKVDLAIVVTPAATVPGVIRECAGACVQGAIIISAGFKEAGPEGLELERQTLAEARRGNMRLIGPNCLGIMCPPTRFNGTFASRAGLAGNVALISQSGALCTAILDWSVRERVGFSAVVSTGSMLDVGLGDLIDYLGDDPRTRSIVIYMESVGEARSFLSAAREVALTKPIIIIKAGRSELAAKAAASHTGALAGSDEVLEAAFRRCGVLRVNSIADIFYMTEVLSKQPRPAGPRLTILTNAGGPGVLATDAVLSLGGQMTELAPETMQGLDRVLPRHWSHNNPVDIIGDAGPERYQQALEIVSRDPNGDGLLVIMTPQGMTDPTQIAAQVAPFAHSTHKPILASWMGGADAEPGQAILNAAGIPTFDFPDTAVRAFQYMWKYNENLRALYETPALAGDSFFDPTRKKSAGDLIERIRVEGRIILTEFESKQILEHYGIPTVPTRLASTGEEAIASAETLGYPVAVKLNSTTITHKTDVGGVRLNLANAAAVREAFDGIAAAVTAKAGLDRFEGVTVQPMIRTRGYELIVGSSIDPQFGPVLLFGLGGELVEVWKDRALALPPLNTTLARRLMEQTRIFTALQGVRGRRPVDMAALEHLLVRFSQLVVEQAWVREIDINPLLASEDSLIALDARVLLHPIGLEACDLPKPAIRPYPAQHIGTWTMPGGDTVTIRPIRPEDEPALVEFHRTLSDETVHMRYFHGMKLDYRTAHERLTRMCFIDYDRQMALVAERGNQILAVGRLIREREPAEAEVAIVVSDAYHRHGLGSEIVRRLIEIARLEGVRKVQASLLSENRAMQKVFARLGFKLTRTQDADVLQAVLGVVTQ